MSNDGNLIETRNITSEEAQECAREQVQYIGTIQPYGMVLVVRLRTGQIVQHSANMLSLLGQHVPTPPAPDTPILDTPLTDWAEIDLDALPGSLASNGTHLIDFGRHGLISSDAWECLGYLSGRYAVLEFMPNSGKIDSAHLLSNLDRMVGRIRSSQSIDELFDNMTREFQQFTGFDRVMLYKFFPDWSGEVLAESVSDRTDRQFVGMRFPAEDIPEKARELYMNASLRIMTDVDATPVPLVPAHLPDGQPLDQSHSVLRGMSKMHIAYLKNMGVKASMSIALMSRGELWGLMAFHHYSPKVPPQHLISEMKASCELFADIVISRLNPELDLERVQKLVNSKQVIDQTFRQLKTADSGINSLDDALQHIQPVLEVDFVGYSLNGRCHITDGDKGWLQDMAMAEKLASLADSVESDVFQSDCLLDPNAPVVLSEQLDIAGIMIAKGRSVPGLLVFFGGLEVEKNINWGGQPGSVNIVIRDGARQLEPRSSFALWRQKVTGHSAPWSSDNRELLEALISSTEDYVLFSENEQTRAKLHKSSYNDPLTGLPNRRYLREFISDLATHPESNQTITVFFLDLDNFKKINDFMGHHAGDQLLVETAKRLKGTVRPDDLVARLGGDEFVVVIQHGGGDTQAHQRTAEKIAEKIIHVVRQPMFSDEKPMVTTPSIGALTTSPCAVSYGEILQRADIAMYTAKQSGKNRVHFFSEEDQQKVYEEGRLELELRKCIENRRLQVYYQPQVSVDRRVTGAEALARWHHPELGFISPDVFIGLAEKNNFIDALGTQVLDMACAQLAAWKAAGNWVNFETLSINISPAQLLADGFVSLVSDTVARHGLKPGDIRLEITESLFIQNFSEAVAVLNMLRSSGFSIALDDFGTGYSSLSYLWKLPIDEVKIDQSFVSNMNDDDDSLTMVEGIISLCKKMNLEIVAEGVEEKIQVSLLRAFGCDTFQGYYFGRPVAPESFPFSMD